MGKIKAKVINVKRMDNKLYCEDLFINTIPCEECNDEQTEIYKGLDKLWYMRVENSHWDSYYDDYDFTDVQINYCPFCGRKLE